MTLSCRECSKNKSMITFARVDVSRIAHRMTRKDGPNEHLLKLLAEAKAELTQKINRSEYHQRTEHGGPHAD